MLDFGQNHHGLRDAVIYARVSSQAQLKAGMGNESQATYCQQYAEYSSSKLFSDTQCQEIMQEKML